MSESVPRSWPYGRAAVTASGYGPGPMGAPKSASATSGSAPPEMRCHGVDA
jgi:hypothetical protein